MKYVLFFLAVVSFSSCSSLRSQSQLTSGYYDFRQPSNHYIKVYVDVRNDSLNIIPIDKQNATSILPEVDQLFLKHSLDVDVLAVPFKFRPSSSGFPRQLTADFNGNIFVGYRIDRYKAHFVKTPAGMVEQLRQRALTLGAFGGLGTSPINPGTTNYQTTDEYSGFILSRGISLMVGINNLTVGIGTGWDYLTDRDKSIWIYQNKPWYGLTLSLNLN